MKSKKVVFQIIIFLSIFSLSAVAFGEMSRKEAQRLKPKSENDSLLYVVRADSAAMSLKHKVVFHLNNMKVVELNYMGVAAVHLKPGKYDIKWECFNKNGKCIKEWKYSGELKPGKIHQTGINHNFVWGGFPIVTTQKNTLLMFSAKFEKELDMRNTIKPL